MIRRLPSDRGAVMPLALVVVTVLPLVVIGLLNLTFSNVRMSTITDEYVDDLYARDGALEFGISEIDRGMAANPSMCGAGGDVALGSTTLNGATVSVSCRLAEDGSAGGSGADEPILYLTGNSADSKSEGYFYFDETEGGTVRVDAKHYNEGKIYVKSGSGSAVDFGRSIEQRGAHCQSSSPPNRLVHSGSPWTCPSSISAFPKDPMPDMWVPSNNAPSRRNSGDCRYFYPGRYGSAPSLSGSRTNFFASGVYYFTNNVGTFDVDNVLVGGAPGSNTQQFASDPCANDAAAWAAAGTSDPDPTDAGVVFIFEKDAAIKIPSDTGNRLELFSYQPGASTGAAPSLLAGYSVIAPTSGGTNTADGGGSWQRHEKSILIETDSLEPGLLSVHGLVFAPETHLKLRLLTNSSSLNSESYMFSAGLIIASVELITSGLPAGEEIHFAGGSVGAAPSQFAVEAHNSATGRTSVAVVRWDPAASPELSLLSWRATDEN